MPRAIVLKYEGSDSSFEISKLERKKLYGYRRRVALDPTGELCKRASMTDDGQYIVRSGMTAQGYFTSSNTWVPNGDMVGLVDGQAVDKIDGTLNKAQTIEESNPQDLLDLTLSTVYCLSQTEVDEKLAEALKAGKIFKFPFNYRADYRAETGYILQGKAGIFALIGVPAAPEWVGPDVPPVDLEEEDEPLDDELDFEMF